MKSMLKVLTRITFVITILLAMNLSSLAAWKNVRANGVWSGQIISTQTCSFTGTGWNAITVENNGTVPIAVQITQTGSYWELKPGQQKTYRKYCWGNKNYRVRIQSLGKTWQTQKIVVKTNRGSIK